MTDSSSLRERGRALEDEHFRRRDAELLQRAEQERERAERNAAELANTRLLADAMGVALESSPVEGAVRRLASAGVTPATAEIVEWLPALRVAWAGGIDAAERDRLLAAAGVATAAPIAIDLLAEWCINRPGREVFDAGLVVLRRRLETLPEDDRALLLDRVMSACDTVSRAAGGWTGLRRVSEAERRVLQDVRAALTGGRR